MFDLGNNENAEFEHDIQSDINREGEDSRIDLNESALLTDNEMEAFESQSPLPNMRREQSLQEDSTVEETAPSNIFKKSERAESKVNNQMMDARTRTCNFG